MIGVINADMLGTPSEPGEHIDWSEPDIFTSEEASFLLGDVAAYAQNHPHMIVWEVDA